MGSLVDRESILSSQVVSSQDGTASELVIVVQFYVLYDTISAALSIRLTRLKPRDPPRAGVHQKQGRLQPFRGRGMLRGPKKLEAYGPAMG